MSVGKYSPTVSRWYAKDQKWWEKNGGGSLIIDDSGKIIGWNQFDKDGYDSYGYHKTTEQDRAGNTEFDYLGGGEWLNLGEENEEYVYPLYENVSSDWWGGNQACPTDDSLVLILDGGARKLATTKDYDAHSEALQISSLDGHH